MGRKPNDNSADWEKLLSSLTKENEEKPMAKGMALLNGIFAMFLLNSVVACGVVLLSMIINSAWNDLLAPAIGYRDAFFLTGILWVIYFIKVAVWQGLTSGANKS